ncbi:hypothetical protein [Nocardia sp. AB354]|uniref:hypothetical protein n=1 Tax=Nocardia sp. AB354 TaxID=3413283 RepID=UPI003C29551F
MTGTTRPVTQPVSRTLGEAVDVIFDPLPTRYGEHRDFVELLGSLAVAEVFDTAGQTVMVHVVDHDTCTPSPALMCRRQRLRVMLATWPADDDPEHNARQFNDLAERQLPWKSGDAIRLRKFAWSTTAVSPHVQLRAVAEASPPAGRAA